MKRRRLSEQRIYRILVQAQAIRDAALRECRRVEMLNLSGRRERLPALLPNAWLERDPETGRFELVSAPGAPL